MLAALNQRLDAAKRKSLSERANKKLNCKNGQCGGRCLRKKSNGKVETCRLVPTKEQAKLWGLAEKAAKKAKSIDISTSIKEVPTITETRKTKPLKSKPRAKSLTELTADLRAYEKTDEYKQTRAGGTIDRLVYLAQSKTKEETLNTFNDAFAKAGMRVKDNDTFLDNATKDIFSQIIPSLTESDKIVLLKESPMLYKDIPPPKTKNKQLTSFTKNMADLYNKLEQKDPGWRFK